MRENRKWKKKKEGGLVIIVGTKKPPACCCRRRCELERLCLLACLPSTYLLTVERVSPVGRIPTCFNLSGRLVDEWVGEWMNGSAEWKGRQKRGQVVCGRVLACLAWYWYLPYGLLLLVVKYCLLWLLWWDVMVVHYLGVCFGGVSSDRKLANIYPLFGMDEGCKNW